MSMKFELVTKHGKLKVNTCKINVAIKVTLKKDKQFRIRDIHIGKMVLVISLKYSNANSKFLSRTGIGIGIFPETKL